MRAITILTIALIATGIVPLGFMQNAYAQPITIDDFSDKTGSALPIARTTAGTTNDNTSPLSGVEGDRRIVDLTWESHSSGVNNVEVDVLTGVEMFSFASDGDTNGKVLLTYPNDGPGLNLDLDRDDPLPDYCFINLNLDFTDLGSIGTVTLTDGVGETASVTQMFPAGAGNFPFYITDFQADEPLLDINDIDKIEVLIDGDDGADIVLNAIRVRECVVVGGTGFEPIALLLADTQLVGMSLVSAIGVAALAIGVVATRRTK